MEQQKKYRWCILLILLAVIFSGCAKKEVVLKEPDKVAELPEPVIITIGSWVMGYYGEDGWHSIQDPAYDSLQANSNQKEKRPIEMYLYQLLQPQAYRLYQGKTGEFVIAKKVYFTDYFDFNHLDLSENPFAGKTFYTPSDLEGILGDYWQQDTDIDNNNIYYFSLPVEFKEDYRKAFPVPDDLFYMGFLDDNNQFMMHHSFGVSSEENGFPHDLQVFDGGTAEHGRRVEDFLVQQKMEDSRFIVSQVWQVDVDGDGKQEEIILAQTPSDQNGYPIIEEADLINEKTAVFVLALLVDETKQIPLYYQQVPIKALYEKVVRDIPDYHIYMGEGKDRTIFLDIGTCLNIEINGIFDFDGDGDFEICLENIEWDCPEVRILELQTDGSWKQVLYGNFAW